MNILLGRAIERTVVDRENVFFPVVDYPSSMDYHDTPEGDVIYIPSLILPPNTQSLVEAMSLNWEALTVLRKQLRSTEALVKALATQARIDLGKTQSLTVWNPPARSIVLRNCAIEA
jgi:hypothetical protein